MLNWISKFIEFDKQDSGEKRQINEIKFENLCLFFLMIAFEYIIEIDFLCHISGMFFLILDTFWYFCDGKKFSVSPRGFKWRTQLNGT